MTKLSAYTDFLSHPKENGALLKDHLISVAKSAASLVSQTRFPTEPAFYAGLLHDIGKLNPFYQDLFNVDRALRSSLEKELEKKYKRQHSLFSAWAASFLLENVVDLRTRNLVMAVIAGHHSELKKRIRADHSETGRNSQSAILQLIPKFRATLSSSSDSEFHKLNWETCLKEFGLPISFQSEVRGREDGISSFLEAGVIFSAMLQGDRGSFGTWSTPNYDLRLDTGKLVKGDSPLGTLRQQFQQKVIEDYKPSDGISVIHAPTGIGKTKVFLDLISRHTGLERVIYFSPLLALTEDFEDKVREVAGNSLEDVLIYNHLFSGMLSQRGNEGYQLDNDRWNFEIESFNSKFIITTTQRLLITLYSNSASDKLKLISFKNSLLILDEIQVIPKFILSNLIALLRELCLTMNSKVLLVSATIPHEVKEVGLPTFGMSEQGYRDYHRLTMKKIEFHEPLSLPDTFNGKVLLMANTRRKAKKLFSSVERIPNAHYLTTGIRKKDRTKLLKEIKESREDCLLVSTQVVEAGVDISFSEIYREVAPLDSIVQVMGRLNREGEVSSPVLHVFLNDRDHRPYAELEYINSIEVLRTVRNSQELYARLDKYYSTVSSRNMLNKSRADYLRQLENKMDFSGVWEMIEKHVFDDRDDPVLIPDSEDEVEKIKAELLSSRRIDRNLFKKYSNLVASLPRSKNDIALEEFFDSDLMDRHVLLPRKEKLHELYDSRMGLDKWLT